MRKKANETRRLEGHENPRSAWSGCDGTMADGKDPRAFGQVTEVVEALGIGAAIWYLLPTNIGIGIEILS